MSSYNLIVNSLLNALADKQLAALKVDLEVKFYNVVGVLLIIGLRRGSRGAE